MKKIKRVLIAAPSSGSGKTMFTCGLLNLLKDKGIDVTSYKCGPDYIDPMFHKKILGICGGNLDTFFTPGNGIIDVLGGCENEYAVIEGVMGIFDGIGGLDITASSYDVALKTDTPVILIIDAHGSGRTVLSLIRGILADDRAGLIKGIVLNRVSDKFYDRLSAFLNEELIKDGYGVKILGFIPVINDVIIASRHLGLVMPDEIPDIKKRIDALSDKLAFTIDVDDIIRIMSDAHDIDYSASIIGQFGEDKSCLRIAVAMDEAFCFYYKENLQLLRANGAELIFFSPIHDKTLPKDIDAIYLGGGYPELYLRQLSMNESMRTSISDAVRSGVYSLAECGGFMYLHDEIEDKDGNTYKMVGVINGKCVWSDKLQRFGYVSVTSDLLSGSVRGHEFHHYVSTADGEDALICKAGSDIKYRSMYISENHIWGFAHLYYPSYPMCIQRIVSDIRNSSPRIGGQRGE